MVTGSPDFTAVMRPSTIKATGIPRNRSAISSVTVTLAGEQRQIYHSKLMTRMPTTRITNRQSRKHQVEFEGRPPDCARIIFMAE
jgi:hypothetical protein